MLDDQKMTKFEDENEDEEDEQDKETKGNNLRLRAQNFSKWLNHCLKGQNRDFFRREAGKNELLVENGSRIGKEYHAKYT